MDKREVMDEVGKLIMRWQDVTQAYDEVVRERHGLSITEGRCLSELYHGPQTAGALAAAVGLTPAAITALLDRLEARGFAVRRRSTEDRRKVVVEMGPQAQEMAERHYGPIGREGTRALEQFDAQELAAVRRFLATAVELQEKHLAAVEAAKRKSRRG